MNIRYMAEYTYLSELEADTAALTAKTEPVVSDECAFLCNLALTDVAKFDTFLTFCQNLIEFGDNIPNGAVAQLFAGTPIKRFNLSTGRIAGQSLWLGSKTKCQLYALNANTEEISQAKRDGAFQLLQECGLIQGLTQLFGAKTNKELDLIVHQICSNYINPNMDSLSINLDTGIERQLSEKLTTISQFDPIVGSVGEDKLSEIVKLRQDHLLHFLKCTRLVNRIYKHINAATPEQKDKLLYLFREIDHTDAHKHLGKEKASKLLHNVYIQLFNYTSVQVDQKSYTLASSFYTSGESAETKSKNEDLYNQVRRDYFLKRFDGFCSFANMLETPVGDNKTLFDSVRQILRMWQMVVHVPM